MANDVFRTLKKKSRYKIKGRKPFNYSIKEVRLFNFKLLKMEEGGINKL